MPAILGLDHHAQVLADLQSQTGATLFEIPTLPPSVPGMRLFAALRRKLSDLGVSVYPNMTVIDFKATANGGTIEWVASETSGRPLKHRAGGLPAGHRRHPGRRLQQRPHRPGLGGDLRPAAHHPPTAQRLVRPPISQPIRPPRLHRRRDREPQISSPFPKAVSPSTPTCGPRAICSPTTTPSSSAAWKASPSPPAWPRRRRSASAKHHRTADRQSARDRAD